MKLKPSSLFEKISGRTANQVIRRSGSNLVSSIYVKPVAYVTDYAVYVKTAYIRAVALWNSLSESQKNQWNIYAKTYTFYDRFGDPYTPNAFQCFIKLQIRNFLAIDTPAEGQVSGLIPIPPGLSVSTIDTFTDICLIEASNAQDATYQIFIYATGPHFVSSTPKFKNYKLLENSYYAAGFSYNAYNMLESRLGRQLKLGENYCFWIRNVDMRTGTESALTSFLRAVV